MVMFDNQNIFWNEKNENKGGSEGWSILSELQPINGLMYPRALGSSITILPWT